VTATDPAAMPAARARVAALLERISRVELGVVVVAPPDDVRLAAQARARAAAELAGRGSLLDEAIAAARETTLRSFARAGFSGTWAATEMAASVATARDRVAAATAFEEAASAAVVEDLVDDDTLETLRATSDELGRATGLPAPGSLSTFASPALDVARGRLGPIVVLGLAAICVVVGAALGLEFALLALAACVAVLAKLARDRGRPEP